MRRTIALCTMWFVFSAGSSSAEVFFAGGTLNIGQIRSTAEHFPNTDLQVDVTSGMGFNDYLALRGQLGYRKVTGKVGSSEPSVTQRFLDANLVVFPSADFHFYLTGGAELYRVTVERPLVSRTTSSWEHGFNAGLGFNIGVGHGPALKIEVLQHWFPHSLPNNLMTISLGVAVGI